MGKVESCSAVLLPRVVEEKLFPAAVWLSGSVEQAVLFLVAGLKNRA